MILTIDGIDVTDRLIDSGNKVSADINDVFGMLAKVKSYPLRDYDDFFNPFSNDGIFALQNYRGREVIEIDDSGVTVFRGTIQNVKETDTQECLVEAAEPLTIFLDWPVDALDKTTYTGYLVNGAHTNPDTTIAVDTGTLSIPVGSVVYFGGTKVPSYFVTAVTPTSGATTSITLDRPIESDIPDNASVIVAVPDTTTGPQALKDALTTSNPDILLDGTFDILAASDLAAGYTIIINVAEQDDVKLREHISTLMEMCDLVLTQKNDGYYTLRRGLEWDGETITDHLTADELCGPIEPDFDDSKLVIGYDLLYKTANNQAAVLTGDVDPAKVEKFRGIKYWRPIKTAASYSQLKYLYANVTSAEYFGNRRLAYYDTPRTVITCTAKPSYNDDATMPLDLYLGKQVKISVRTFTNEPAIVVGLEYDKARIGYSRVAFQLNDVIMPIGRTSTNSEDDDMVTGQYIQFAGTSAPSGFLACDGAAVSRSTYAGLFSVISTTYGVGDGSTTFNLPDHRGLVMVGAGAHGTMTRANGSAYDGGSVGASRNDQMQGHLHTVNPIPASYNASIGAGSNSWSGSTAQNTGGPITDGANGTPRTGNETRPAEIAVLVCIKY